MCLLLCLFFSLTIQASQHTPIDFYEVERTDSVQTVLGSPLIMPSEDALGIQISQKFVILLYTSSYIKLWKI